MTRTNSINETISAHDEGEDLPRMGDLTPRALDVIADSGESCEPIFRERPGFGNETAAPNYEVAALIKERDGWQEHAKWLQRHLHLTQCDNTLLRAQAKKDTWVWQSDGTDYLESMGNRMVVVIFARDLRAAIAAAGDAA
jgi:hypothetical protein